MSKAVVIGTGFGGLSSAVRLVAKGYDVTMVDKNNDPGGRARRFTRDGFSFDAGPTVITAPYLIEELFALLGEDMKEYLELLPVDPFYRVAFDDQTHFDYVGDRDRLLENIKQLEPKDVEGYEKFYKHACEIFDIGYTRLADYPFSSWKDMVKIMPDFMRLQNYKTVYGLASKYFKSEKLRQVFSFQPLLVGGNPFTITSIYLLIHPLERKWGVHFPKGGTYSIVEALVKLLKKRGVEFIYGDEVSRLEVSNKKIHTVQTLSGKSIPADVVVNNGDPTYTYTNLIDKKHLMYNKPWLVKKMKQSMSLFVAYFGTNREYKDLKQHTIVLGPRYKGLLDDIFKKQVLAKDFSLYLHASKRTDENLYPDGKDGFYVLSPVPNNKSGIDWSKEGEGYFQRILESLEGRMMPGLRDSLETSFYITPDYFKNQLLSTDGAAFGIEPLFRQSAYFRYHNQSSDISNMFFVGANTHPGAGIPGVLNSAKVTDRLINNIKRPVRSHGTQYDASQEQR